MKLQKTTEESLLNDIRTMVNGSPKEVVKTINKWNRYFIAEEKRLAESRLPIDKILHDVSEKTGISVARIISKESIREVAEARFFFCYRAKLLTGCSLSFIAKKINNRTHSAVINAIKQVQDVKQLRERYAELFEGKVKTTIENKAILIGKSPVKEIPKVKTESKYKNKPTVNNRAYSGYREHQI